MNNTRDDIHYDDRTWLLTDGRGGCDIWQHRREGCHVRHLGWNSQVCWEFSFHVRTAAGVLYRNSEDFPLHFRVFWHCTWWIQFRSPNRSVPLYKIAFLPHHTSHGVCWNLEMCAPFRYVCSGRMKKWFLQTTTDIHISLWSSTLFTCNTWLVRNVVM